MIKYLKDKRELKIVLIMILTIFVYFLLVSCIKTSEKESVKFSTYDFKNAKYQGIVKDIDYENRVITIENANTGKLDELEIDEDEVFTITKVINGAKCREINKIEGIKLGNYLVAQTAKDTEFYPELFEGEPDKIIFIFFSEKKWY